jgi:hypothetical protein
MLILVIDVVLFFQGKNFIVRFGMVGCIIGCGHLKLLVVGSFLLFVVKACRIMVAALLVVSVIFAFLVVAILLVLVAVTVVVPIVATGIVCIYSFWVASVATFGI